MLESALAAVSDPDVEIDAQPAEQQPKEQAPDGDDPWQDTGSRAA
jgi:hypothetical protein